MLLHDKTGRAADHQKNPAAIGRGSVSADDALGERYAAGKNPAAIGGAGDGNGPWLMASSTPLGNRRLPSATDVLVIAEDQDLNDVHLARVGRISSGLWSDSSGWLGAAAPDLSQDVYIRHGGQVTLDADAQIRELYLGNGNGLALPNRRLETNGLTTINGTMLVHAGGSFKARGADHDVVVGQSATGRLEAKHLTSITIEQGDLVVGDGIASHPGGQGFFSADHAASGDDSRRPSQSRSGNRASRGAIWEVEVGVTCHRSHDLRVLSPLPARNSVRRMVVS